MRSQQITYEWGKGENVILQQQNVVFKGVLTKRIWEAQTLQQKKWIKHGVSCTVSKSLLFLMVNLKQLPFFTHKCSRQRRNNSARSRSNDTSTTTRTTTKPFVPSIWGRLHEPKENYTRSGIWISFLHSFLQSNMPSLRPLASISCRITSIHVFFGLPCALLTCPKLICSTRRTGASVGLRRT